MMHAAARECHSRRALTGLFVSGPNMVNSAITQNASELDACINKVMEQKQCVAQHIEDYTYILTYLHAYIGCPLG